MTRGLMIAAPRSGSGKTTVTLGLLRAFRRGPSTWSASSPVPITSIRPSTPRRRGGRRQSRFLGDAAEAPVRAR